MKSKLTKLQSLWDEMVKLSDGFDEACDEYPQLRKRLPFKVREVKVYSIKCDITFTLFSRNIKLITLHINTYDDIPSLRIVYSNNIERYEITVQALKDSPDLHCEELNAVVDDGIEWLEKTIETMRGYTHFLSVVNMKGV